LFGRITAAALPEGPHTALSAGGLPDLD
jgi:hypothetical protein